VRRIRYSVVTSLDGYIAGPKGDADWITRDPDFDFTAIFRQFDTILVGRLTFDTMVAAGRVSMPGMKTIVFSRTLRQEDHPKIAIVGSGQGEAIASLKGFRSLAEDGR
jgi:dihydrofolate reductase